MAGGIPARLTAAEGRKFGFTVGAALVVLGAVALWRGHRLVGSVMGVLGAVLLLAALVVPTLLGPVQRGWMALGLAMSKVTTPILMSAVYYVVLTPMGLLMRAFGRNPLRQPEHNGSFWQPRDDRRSDLQRQF